MDVITLYQLHKAGACDEADIFENLFGGSVTVTEELARQHAQSFDWTWASEALLYPDAGTMYNKELGPARKAHRKAINSAREKYREVLEPARKAHKMELDLARDEYDKGAVPDLWLYNIMVASANMTYHDVTAPAREARNEVIDASWKVYREAQAVAFARAYLSM